MTACSRSAQDDARDIVACEDHIASVQTQTALEYQARRVEAEATRSAANALA
jgi:hypothetical protein